MGFFYIFVSQITIKPLHHYEKLEIKINILYDGLGVRYDSYLQRSQPFSINNWYYFGNNSNGTLGSFDE